ncbi:MerR family transcriptional regulator [Loigolactobacillus bifermentans]|nr:MerR family transcriptional regulator [Loigolactobacillus bifermentans]
MGVQPLGSLMMGDRFILGIGQISEMTGVSPRQLRYWEKRGYIQPLAKKDGETRQYKAKTVVTILGIKHFLDEGYTLQAAVKKMTVYDQQIHKLHQFIRRSYHGVVKIDGHNAVDLGFFDLEQTQRLYGILDSDKVYYQVLPADQAPVVPENPAE